MTCLQESKVSLCPRVALQPCCFTSSTCIWSRIWEQWSLICIDSETGLKDIRTLKIGSLWRNMRIRSSNLTLKMQRITTMWWKKLKRRDCFRSIKICWKFIEVIQWTKSWTESTFREPNLWKVAATTQTTPWLTSLTWNLTISTRRLSIIRFQSLTVRSGTTLVLFGPQSSSTQSWGFSRFSTSFWKQTSLAPKMRR